MHWLLNSLSPVLHERQVVTSPEHVKHEGSQSRQIGAVVVLGMVQEGHDDKHSLLYKLRVDPVPVSAAQLVHVIELVQV